jgi:hypothetical protein
MIVPCPVSSLKGSPPWHEARGQGDVVVRLCIAATLGAIPGPSIDVAQWGEYACVVHCNGKRVSRARKEGLVSQYTAVSTLMMKGRGLSIIRKL